MDEMRMDPVDCLEIVKRRKWSIILPALIIFLAAAATAFTRPSIYRSTATILIKERDVPEDFAITMESYAEKRIQYINQRIMSTNRLLDIIQRLNLYADVHDRPPTAAVVEKMREDVVLKPISIEFTDRRTGRTTAPTIAFTLSYEGRVPEQVREVAFYLASLFIEENQRERLQQVEDTKTFMENETAKLRQELEALDARIVSFKQEHVNELPEMLPANMQNLIGIERNIEVTSQRLRSLKEHEVYLRNQLVTVKPHIDDENEVSIRKRLEELKVQLLYLTKRFSDQYPDVRKTRAEIAELESRLSAVAADRKQAPPDNPSHINLAVQLAGTRSEIKSVRNELAKLQENADQYRRWIAITPKVEKPYNALVANRNIIQDKYNEMMGKLIEARFTFGAEKHQKTERFTLLEPPGLPNRPFKPNRPAIMAIGLILGIINGIGLAAFKEFTDYAVWDPKKLEKATSLPVLSTIPEIPTRQDVAQKKRVRRLIAATAVLAVAGGVVVAVFHFWGLDFKTLWSKLM